MPFPAEKLETLYRQRIKQFSDNAEKLQIFFCHQFTEDMDRRLTTNTFRLWGGFASAKQLLWQTNATKQPPPPILILGLHSADQLKDLTTDTDLLDWSGAAYLQYSLDDTTLKETTVRLLECEKKPPDNLLKDPRLNLIVSAIHWLEQHPSPLLAVYINAYKQWEQKKEGLAPFIQETSTVTGLRKIFHHLTQPWLYYSPLESFSEQRPGQDIEQQWQEFESEKHSVRTALSNSGQIEHLNALIQAAEQLSTTLEDWLDYYRKLRGRLEPHSKTP